MISGMSFKSYKNDAIILQNIKFASVYMCLINHFSIETNCFNLLPQNTLSSSVLCIDVTIIYLFVY